MLKFYYLKSLVYLQVIFTDATSHEYFKNIKFVYNFKSLLLLFIL